MDRRKFLQTIGTLTAGAVVAPKRLFSQENREQIPKTFLKETNEKFKNGEAVHSFEKESGEKIGEFWPIKGINLVTRETDPNVFTGDMKTIHKKLGGVATAPDGMTKASMGSYKMEGKSLANGVECGDGIVQNTGIVVVEKGSNITFTHKQEHLNDFDTLYEDIKNKKGTLFFLPSIYRNGKYLPSDNKLDKVLIRRNVPIDPTTPKGEQLAVILFDKMVTYNEAREYILGLDRKNTDGTDRSSTTHIYFLDGGPTWGQSAKEVNGQVEVKGTRDPSVITNYLAFY